jgi:hypothetical protein
MVSRRSSAIRERSSITPMKMNNGIASSTSLVMTPKMRSGRAPRSAKLMMPAAEPAAANNNETPASVSATGYPTSSNAQTANTIPTTRTWLMA